MKFSEWLNEANGKVISVKLRNEDWEVEIIDSTHLKMRLKGTDKWGIGLHTLQVPEEVIKQLVNMGISNGRSFKE